MTFSHRAAAGQQLLAVAGLLTLISQSKSEWPFCDIQNLRHRLTGGLHSPNCQVIVKSPADTTLQGCGYEVANFAQPACATLNLDTTFMVQFCCGTGDCQSAGAGIKRSAKFERDIASSSGGGGLYLKDVNGTVIQPVKVGEVEATASGTGEEKRDPAPESVFARSNCEEGSWVADPNRDDYTRPADNTQVVLTGVSGPQTVKITTTRSQSWTSTLGASVGIEDIFSLGLSFEQSFTKEISDSTSRSFQVQDGQTGDALLLVTVARFRVRSALRTKMEVASSPAFTGSSSPPKSSVAPGCDGMLPDGEKAVWVQRSVIQLSRWRTLNTTFSSHIAFSSARASLPSPILSLKICSHVTHLGSETRRGGLIASVNLVDRQLKPHRPYRISSSHVAGPVLPARGTARECSSCASFIFPFSLWTFFNLSTSTFLSPAY
ncbi:hypothetical protein KC359_g146 [Hortaea werneckii]|nr:hypothetical protein KC359_g146 [Hortaea werneckii]